MADEYFGNADQRRMARRGEGIAKALGAMAMLEAADRLQAKVFRTGIRDGNVASERLCNARGVFRSEVAIVAAIDPEVMGEARLTK